MGVFLPQFTLEKKSLVPFGAFSYLVGIPISKTFKVPPFREVFANYVICSCIDRTEEHEAHETMYMTSQNRNNQQSTVQGGMKFQKLGLLINPFFHFPTQKKHQHNCTSQLHAIDFSLPWLKTTDFNSFHVFNGFFRFL